MDRRAGVVKSCYLDRGSFEGLPSIRLASSQRASCCSRLRSRKILAAGAGLGFHAFEPALEGRVCSLQSGFGLDAQVPGQVGHDEEDITHLGAGPLRRGRLAVDEFLLEFIHLLAHLGHDIGGFAPVEADGRRLLGHAKCLEEGRESGGDAIEGRRRLLVGALVTFDVLPVAENFIGILDLEIAEYVGVAPDHLVADPVADVIEIEPAVFPTDAGHEDDLKQEIAEFLAKLGRFVGSDGLGHFVRLLEEIGGKGG